MPWFLHSQMQLTVSFPVDEAILPLVHSIPLLVLIHSSFLSLYTLLPYFPISFFLWLIFLFSCSSPPFLTSFLREIMQWLCVCVWIQRSISTPILAFSIDFLNDFMVFRFFTGFFPELQTVLLPRVCFRNTVHHFHMKSWWNVQFCVEYLDDVFNLLCTFWQFKPLTFMCQIDELCFNLHNILCIIIWSIFWTIILQNRKSEFSLNLCGKFF